MSHGRSGLAIGATKINASASPLASALAIGPPEWTGSALCAQTDPEAFYPEKGASVRAGKATCMACPVRVECLDYAVANRERFGIWGGLSERERRKLQADTCRSCGVDITGGKGAPRRCEPCRTARRREQRGRAA